VKLTSQLYLELRLSISGAIPLFLVCFFFHGVGRGCVGGEIIDFEHDGGTRCILINLFFNGSYFALLSFQVLGPAPLRL
jgi:hypothetical protein